MVGVIEVDAFEAVAARALAPALADLLARARDLNQRVAATRFWASAADTADYALAGWRDGGTPAERAAVGQWLTVLRRLRHGRMSPAGPVAEAGQRPGPRAATTWQPLPPSTNRCQTKWP